LLEINKAEKDYDIQYNSLLEERKKYDLELLKYKELQVSELKTIFKRVQMILSNMDNNFNLNSGSEITSEDYEKHQVEYFAKNHKEINKELRSILSDTFLFYSILSPLFDKATNSIIILMNRINTDREDGIAIDEQDYMYKHIDQIKSSINNLNLIIEEIRKIIEPIKA